MSMGRDQRVPQPRISAGPWSVAIWTKPAHTASTASSRSRGRSLSISTRPPRRCGPRPGPPTRPRPGPGCGPSGSRGHLHQLARPTGSERRRPVDHPSGRGGTVRARDHTTAQRLGQYRDPGRLNLPGQVVNLPEERPQLVVADRTPPTHRAPVNRGSRRPARVEGRRRVDRRSPCHVFNLDPTTDRPPTPNCAVYP